DPFALAAGGRAGSSKERLIAFLDEVEARVGVADRRVVVKDERGMRSAEDVARALLIGVAVRELPVLLTLARGQPLVVAAEAFARVLARGLRDEAGEIAVGDHARTRDGHRRRIVLLLPRGQRRERHRARVFVADREAFFFPLGLNEPRYLSVRRVIR